MSFSITPGTAVPRYALLVAGALALMSWLTPTHGIPWTSFHEDALMGLAASMTAVAVIWASGRRALELPVPAVATLLVAAIPCIQSAAGLVVFRGDAVITALYLAGFALAQMIGHRSVALWGEERSLRALSGVIVTAGVVSVWLALCQWQRLDYFDFALSELPLNARPFANLNQPNQLATLLVLALVGVGVFHAVGQIGLACAGTLVAMLGFGLAMTQSRAGMMECAVVGALLLARRRDLGALSAKRVVGGLALLALMAFAWQLIRDVGAPTAPLVRDAHTLAEIGARGPHWGAMLDEIGRSPWVGYGWGQGANAQYLVAPDHPAAPGIFDFGHNLVLDLLVWNGVPIGGLVVAGLVGWFWFALRGARSPSQLLALAAVVAVFTHAMVEYPLYYASFMLPTGALVGGLTFATMPRPAITAPRWLFAIATGAAMAVLLVVMSEYLRLEEDVRMLRFEQARIGVHRPPHVLSEPQWLTHMSAFTHFVRAPQHAGMTEGELDAMAAVVHRFPSGQNIVRYAAALAVNDRPQLAANALRRVCKMTRPAGCEEMKLRWQAIGEGEPKVAKVAWPE